MSAHKLVAFAGALSLAQHAFAGDGALKDSRHRDGVKAVVDELGRVTAALRR